MPLTPNAWPNDRRRIGRSTNERRDRRTRLEGLWTEAERTRFIRILREERQEAKAITIQDGREHPNVTGQADGGAD